MVGVEVGGTFRLERDAAWRALLVRGGLEGAPASLVQVMKDPRAFLQLVLVREEVALWAPGGPWTHVEAAS